MKDKKKAGFTLILCLSLYEYSPTDILADVPPDRESTTKSER